MDARTFGPDHRYALLEEIGEGGFARVFRARDGVTNRQVALKVLKDAFVADPQIVERFNREVFAIASLSSPHVVTMYDFGLSDEEFFIAMEYLEGPTLREVIKEPVWGAAEVHRVIGQIAQALAVAHKGGILHRDLKPENIKLLKGRDGAAHVKVLDFGFAKLASLEAELQSEPVTRVGSAFGTPHYMSPEQALGKSTDEAMDLYALAVIAYEMLARRRPFGGKDPYEVMQAVVKHPAPEIVPVHPSVSRVAEVNAFFVRALAKEKSQRPATAADFFFEFERALTGSDAPRPEGDAVFAGVLGGSLDAGDGFVSDTMQWTLAEIIAHKTITSKWKLKAISDANAKEKSEKLDAAWVKPIETARPVDAKKHADATIEDRHAADRFAEEAAAKATEEEAGVAVAAPVEVDLSATEEQPAVLSASRVTLQSAGPAPRRSWWIIVLVILSIAIGVAIGLFLVGKA